MGVTVATTRVACNTSTGTQDITTSDCGGLTPVAAIFIATLATSDGTPVDGAALSVGFAVSSSERLVCSTYDEHDFAQSDTYRRMTEDECVMLLTDTGGIDGEADFSAWITNGCTINWGNAPAAAYLLTVIFFCGSDVSAHVDTTTAPSTINTSTDVTDPGFEPDVVLVASTRSAFNDTTIANAAMSLGCAVNTTGDENYSINMSGPDVLGTSENAENSRSNRCLFNIFGQSDQRFGAVEITDFDANGFSAWTRDKAGANTFGYLALNFNNAADVWLGDISSPTSTGDDAETSPSFTPQAVIVGIGRDPSFATVDTGNQLTSVYSVGIGVITENAEYSNVISSEDNIGTMNTQSLSDNQAINAPEDDGGTAADLQATGPSGSGSFDANGFTLNYTQVDSGQNIGLWALAIEAEAGGDDINVAIVESDPAQWKTGVKIVG